MYKIIKDGAVVAMTEAPNYIKLQDNGCLSLCGEEEAQGIAHNGTVYHLSGRQELPDTEDVILAELDAGAELALTRDTLSDTDAMGVDHEYRLTLLELGVV